MLYIYTYHTINTHHHIYTPHITHTPHHMYIPHHTHRPHTYTHTTQTYTHYHGLMLKLKLQYFGHPMRRTDSLEKTLMLGKIEGGRRRG